jgi:hypothetical protein
MVGWLIGRSLIRIPASAQAKYRAEHRADESQYRKQDDGTKKQYKNYYKN